VTGHDDRSQRPPPAFQEYAADMLAAGLGMDLDKVGLLVMMRWRYWTSGPLPRDPRRLGREVGLDPRKIRARLTHSVLAHFAVDPTNDQRLICPELDRQRAALDERRARQIAGGREGRARQLAGVSPRVTPESDRTRISRTYPGVSEKRRQPLERELPTESIERRRDSGAKASSEKSAARQNLTPEQQGWADDYERAS